jgi:hypothetical protein
MRLVAPLNVSLARTMRANRLAATRLYLKSVFETSGCLAGAKIIRDGQFLQFMRGQSFLYRKG